MSATASSTNQALRRKHAGQPWRNLLLARLKRIRRGRLTLVEAGQSHWFGNDGDGPNVTIEVTDSRCYGEICLNGSIGAAEAYIKGFWRASNLTQLIRLFVLNRDLMDGLERGPARLAQPLLKGYHWLRRNTRRGSRKNIAAHYDLGNEFFSLFLDPAMMYSSAVFPKPGATLEQASEHKLDLICQKLALKPEHEVIEIGTGWGGFAIHAARNYGCRVTTTTISRQQFDYATQAVAEAGLTDKVTVIDQDYRNLKGRFDRLVSIEMIEAVGHQFFDAYFHKISELLKPCGAALIQSIVIADNNYRQAMRSVDFIKRYIFPGGCLPSTSVIMDSISRTTDCLLVDLHDIGLHYADTLLAWRQRFDSQLDAVRAQGFSDEFIRMWEYYLCYCEGAFLERAISGVQLLFQRPNCKDLNLRAAV